MIGGSTMSRQGFGRLVAAELLKVRTTRTGWVLPAVAIMLPLVFPVGSAIKDEGLSADVQSAALAVATVIAAMVMVGLGALAVTSEFRHRTGTPTALAAPHRGRVLAAKYVAAVVVATAVALVSIAATAAVVAALAATTGEPFAIGDELLTVVPRALAGIVLWTSAGVAIGSALRNSAGALVGIYLGWAALPMATAAAAPKLVQWVKPLDAVGVVAGLGDLMSIGQAIATLAAWIALPAAVGLVALRRDIT